MKIRKVTSFLMTVVCLSIPAHSIANTLKDDAGFESCIASEDFYECMEQVKLLEDPEAQLREEMKSLSFTLSSITSLPDLESERIELREKLTDLLSIEGSDTLASNSARIAQELYLVSIDSWLNAKPYSSGQIYGDLYRCGKVVRNGIDLFNSSVGSNAIEYKIIKKAPIWGMEYCDIQVVEYYEKEKLRFIAGILRDGAIHPSRLREWSERRYRAMEEISRSNWEKYLDENPTMRVWADANPEAARRQSEIFNKKNPVVNPSMPPTYIEASPFLSKLSRL